MTLQYSEEVRNAKQNVIETTIGPSPILEFRTGDQPENCAASSSGSLLGTGVLPSDWLTSAVNGSKSKNGTWTVTGLADIVTADIGHYRIYEAGRPSVCHEQGSVTVTGGGGTMTVDNISMAALQVATVTGYTKTDGNS